jgi:hypothetical protein
MASRKDKEKNIMDTPLSLRKPDKTGNNELQLEDTEFIAQLEMPLDEDSFQSLPPNAIQAMLFQMAEQLKETQAQLAEIQTSQRPQRPDELEITAKTRSSIIEAPMSDVVKKSILDNIARFDAALAPTSGSMARNFFASLEAAFEALEINDNRQQVAILRSKMAQNETTNSWLSSIKQDHSGLGSYY